MRCALTSDTHYGFTEKTHAHIEQMLIHLQQEKPDVILHAGDWNSTRFSEMKPALELFRKYFPDTPIVSVLLANHQMWNGDAADSEWRCKTIRELVEREARLFEEYNILREWVTDEVAIIGYDSWFRTVNPPSNCYKWMPGGQADHLILHKMAADDFEYRVLPFLHAHASKKRIVVSHFSPYNYRYGYTMMCGPLAPFELMTADLRIDYLCLGHSHEAQYELRDDTRILNSGSDYNRPRFVVFAPNDPQVKYCGGSQGRDA